MKASGDARSGLWPVLTAAILISMPASARETRGMRPAVYRAPAAGLKGLSGDVTVYEHSYAVVIGIDKYAGSLPPLKGAVRDALNVAEALEKQGFAVTPIVDENATKDRITGLLGDELPLKVGREDRVLVYFAGHGVMIDVVKWFGDYPGKHVMFVAVLLQH